MTEYIKLVQKKQRIQRLIIQLSFPEPTDRKHAANALAGIGPEAAVPALTKALKDDDKDVRSESAKALKEIGPAAKDAVPTLIESVKDKNEFVRWHAAEALGKIGPEAETAVPVLIGALTDESTLVRDRAASALGGIEPAAKTAVPHLIEALKDKSNSISSFAALALGQIGPDAEDAVPMLIEGLKEEKSEDELPEVRPLFVFALSNIIPGLKVANQSYDEEAENKPEVLKPNLERIPQQPVQKADKHEK